MNKVSVFVNKNVAIAASIGAVLGLIAGGKSGDNLWLSVLFGLVVGILVGYLGNLRSEDPPNKKLEDDSESFD